MNSNEQNVGQNSKLNYSNIVDFIERLKYFIILVLSAILTEIIRKVSNISFKLSILLFVTLIVILALCCVATKIFQQKRKREDIKRYLDSVASVVDKEVMPVSNRDISIKNVISKNDLFVEPNWELNQQGWGISDSQTQFSTDESTKELDTNKNLMN
ncbi:hypothetical protein ACSAZK_02275 [Methanosarcina sp. Mfa9]|uniref:hypothetical protein n=1 Tax=Methanosarcina sp. Mfa9 TaxID=3439063 RepID=UPI003F8280E5